MASFSIPLTGLEADSTALNTIANNLSNMNTTAYKAQTTNFSDLFYEQIGTTGSGNAIQVGAGTQVASNQTNFTQGSYNTTDTTSSDVAIDGNGFFVVSDGSSNLYTRDGTFTQDSNGNLVTASGQSVMGYPAVNGVVDTNASLTAINIPVTGQVQQAQATTSLSMTANLNASATTSTAGFSATVPVYDSLGGQHTVTVTYTKTGDNTWSYSAALPASDFTSGVSTPVTGTMSFDSSGNLASITTGGVTTNVGTASGDTSSIDLDFSGLSSGAANLSMKWNLVGTNGTSSITQEALGTNSSTGEPAASTESNNTANGYATGTYESFAIGSDGTVTATYSNGQKQAVGMLALANVTNLQGLQLEGNGDYATTLASGTASIAAPGTNGLGSIKDSELEASNVNISAEFSNLIIAQRAFEANSKAVTTFDSVTQETINMIH
jgi:flagellar hook protein FlgE